MTRVTQLNPTAVFVGNDLRPTIYPHINSFIFTVLSLAGPDHHQSLPAVPSTLIPNCGCTN